MVVHVPDPTPGGGWSPSSPTATCSPPSCALAPASTATRIAPPTSPHSSDPQRPRPRSWSPPARRTSIHPVATVGWPPATPPPASIRCHRKGILTAVLMGREAARCLDDPHASRRDRAIIAHYQAEREAIDQREQRWRTAPFWNRRHRRPIPERSSPGHPSSRTLGSTRSDAMTTQLPEILTRSRSPTQRSSPTDGPHPGRALLPPPPPLEATRAPSRLTPWSLDSLSMSDTGGE